MRCIRHPEEHMAYPSNSEEQYHQWHQVNELRPAAVANGVQQLKGTVLMKEH